MESNEQIVMARTKKLMFVVDLNPSFKKTTIFMILAETAKTRTATVARPTTNSINLRVEPEAMSVLCI